MKNSLPLTVAIAGVALFQVTTVRAAVFNIANGDVAGLRAALLVCQSNNQDNTINLPFNGRFVFTDALASGYALELTPELNYSLTLNGTGSLLIPAAPRDSASSRIAPLAGTPWEAEAEEPRTSEAGAEPGGGRSIPQMMYGFPSRLSQAMRVTAASAEPEATG